MPTPLKVMKIFNKIAMAALAMSALTACTEDYVDDVQLEGAAVDFTYNVDGDEYLLDYARFAQAQGL